MPSLISSLRLFVYAGSLSEKTVWVSCVSLGCDRGDQNLGKGGMVTTTVKEGSHHLGTLQGRSTQAAVEGSPWPGRCNQTHGCRSCFPINPACLSLVVLLLSSPRLSGRWALVVAGMGWDRTGLPCLPAAAGRGTVCGPAALSQKWEEAAMVLT